MSIRVMLDTDVLADLDGHFEILATYTDLIPDMAALDALRAKYPGSEVILIDRGLGDPTGQATIADVEPGAMTPDDLPGWVARKRADKPAGWEFLTAYSDRNDLPAIEAIQHEGLWHWVATLDGTCFITGWRPLHGPAAVQILGEAAIGIHGDLSLVLEDQWHPRRPFPAAADVPAAPAVGIGGAGDGHHLPAGQAAAAETAAELAARAPAWEITQDGETYIAVLTGTRTQLSAADVGSLESRICQLYPETVSD